jgi:hypothetical protein
LGFKPDTPDEVVVLYNTRGKMDGRDMRTGVMMTHPGIMFMVRAADEYAVFAKTNDIKEFIDAVRRNTVDIEDQRYRIDAITRTSDPIALGQETGNTRRLYSLNAIATITALGSIL